jgi:hypothetical protein
MLQNIITLNMAQCNQIFIKQVNNFAGVVWACFTFTHKDKF